MPAELNGPIRKQICPALATDRGVGRRPHVFMLAASLAEHGHTTPARETKKSTNKQKSKKSKKNQKKGSISKHPVHTPDMVPSAISMRTYSGMSMYVYRVSHRMSRWIQDGRF